MTLGLFKKRRNQASGDYVEMPAADGDALVEDLGTDVLAIMDVVDLPDHIRRALTAGLVLITQRDLPHEALVSGGQMAKLGWATRSVEYTRLQTAHRMDLELAERLEPHLLDTDEPLINVVAAFAARLVLSEPPRPTVEQGGPLWSIPGLGGDLRLALADKVMDLSDLPSDVGPYDMLAAWKFGFYMRVMDGFFLDERIQQ